MTLVSEAGSMRVSGSCEAMIWPLVASSSSQDGRRFAGPALLRAGGRHQEGTGGQGRD
jgi:hypothetical protein